MHKQVRELITWAETIGFTYAGMHGSGHHKLEHTGGQTVTVPASPSDPRWVKNAKAEIRRIAGVSNDSPRAARYRHQKTRMTDMRQSSSERAASASHDRLLNRWQSVQDAYLAAKATAQSPPSRSDCEQMLRIVRKRDELRTEFQQMHKPIPGDQIPHL